MSKHISKFEIAINRYNPVIFISIICLTLAIIVLIFYSIYNTSTEASNDETPSSSSIFNQKTIDRVKKLNTPNDENKNFTLPDGRINPFI